MLIPTGDCVEHKLRRRAVGFTLIEVVVVMIITSIIAALALPRLLDRDVFNDIGTTDQVRGSLRYAQRMAVTRNRDVCVAVAPVGITFTTALQAGVAQPCTAAVLQFGDSSSIDVTAALGNLPTGYSLTPAVNFRFTASGILTNNLGVAIATQTIFVRRTAVNVGSITVQRDNGYVL